MDMMVIIWVGIGLLIFALSFILPKRKEELDEDTKKFAGEQIRDILNQEIAGIQSKLDNVVSETIDESAVQTERALEKMTNEKIMAINEYSDTVIEDINNNHKEVLFLYDMLNDKHVTIRNTVTEVERTIGEVTQTAKDIEISAKEAAKRANASKEAAERAADITNHAEKAAQRIAQNMEMDMRHMTEEMIRGRVEETMEKTALPMIQERVDAILEDATILMEQKPKILVDYDKADGEEDGSEVKSGLSQLRERSEIAEKKDEMALEESAEESIADSVEDGSVTKEATTEDPIKADSITEDFIEENSVKEDTAGNPVNEESVAGDSAESTDVQEVEFVQGITENAPQIVIAGTDEDNLSYYVVEAEPTENKDSVSDLSGETESRTESKESFEPTALNSWMQGIASDNEEQNKEGRNNNDKILALHKEGMSDLAIAKELKLGVGEVKLVIDLFKGM